VSILPRMAPPDEPGPVAPGPVALGNDVMDGAALALDDYAQLGGGKRDGAVVGGDVEGYGRPIFLDDYAVGGAFRQRGPGGA
jgi:hypothetical protein